MEKKTNKIPQKKEQFIAYITKEERDKLMEISVFNKTLPRDCFGMLINRVYESEKLRWLASKMEKELTERFRNDQ